MATTPFAATVVIPSLDRPVELAACVRSLQAQTRRDYELVILKERGPLAAIRNQGLRAAQGAVVCFLDDDVICPPTWLAGVLDTFQQHPDAVGVTGPALITPYYRQQRDLFRYPRLRGLYDRLFLDVPTRPGRICPSGAFTTAASEEDCAYEGPVDYLEACNMSFRNAALQTVGGFDEGYGGIGDWSEPDVCYRLRQHGGQLWFTPAATLFHQPARTGAFALRRRTGARLRNYALFSRRWVRPHWRHTLYWGFLRTYYAWKEITACWPSAR